MTKARMIRAVAILTILFFGIMFLLDLAANLAAR